MKHKVSEIDGTLLDEAVALAEGGVKNVSENSWEFPDNSFSNIEPDHDCKSFWQPSVDWRQGGEIIERERIELLPYSPSDRGWYAAARPERSRSACGDGPTPLVAAMRAYVASKLGLEVELS